jgi:peptide/nickel transport system permease protein
MPPFARFLIRRVIAIPVTFILVTAVLYGLLMLTPPETRASLYMPRNASRMTVQGIRNMTNRIIETHHLNDPYPVQYTIWLGSLMRGELGWSPALNGDVKELLIKRSGITLELTLYSLLFFIPLGLVSGVIAGWRHNRLADHAFRLSAFISTSLPQFILAIMLIAVFYIWLHWFPLERVTTATSSIISSGQFKQFTGLVTIDGLLNKRPDVTLDALWHLVLPVISLSLVHWATLGRVTRVSVMDERQKEYILSGKARGIPARSLVWKHIFRNIIAPGLTSSALSAASLFTGVIVIELTFNLKGISSLIMDTVNTPDTAVTMGFSVYSVVVILLLMLVLDVIQAVIDPRVQFGEI